MSDTEKTEITKVMMVIREFLSETRDVVSSAEKSQQWIIQFRNTLCYQDLEGNPNKFALKLLAEARGFSDLKRRNQQMRWVRESLAKDGISNPSKKQLEERWMLIYGSGENPQDAPNGNAGGNMSDARNGAASKTPTSCDQFKADGDTREGSHDGKSGTSANIYATRQAKNGDAHHREAGDESATVSKPFALDSLTRQGQTTAKTRDSRVSGRYQPPSLGPEDGNLYDQETTIEISTDEKRTGGHSPLSRSPSSRSPVRERRVTGDVLTLAYSGEFQNVRLTQEQYNELGIRFGNQQKLNRAIDSLSCKIENEEIKPRNHYAELLKWVSYRDDMEEKEELKASSAPHYETVSEHNARIVAEGKKWIDEHFPKKDNKNG